jgi:hypothetical protein
MSPLYILVLLGLFMFAAGCIGHGKPLAKRYIFLMGGVAFLLLFLGIWLIVSK